MTRDNAIEAILVGLAAGAIGAAAAVCLNVGVHTADVLAFVGAVFGAAITVAGTAWLSDRSANREVRVEQKLIRDELHIVADASAGALEAWGDGNWSDLWRSRLSGLSDISYGANRFLGEVVAHARTLDFHQREAIAEARKGVTAFVSFHDDVFSVPDYDDPLDERSWPGVIGEMLAAVKSALLTFPRSR